MYVRSIMSNPAYQSSYFFVTKLRIINKSGMWLEMGVCSANRHIVWIVSLSARCNSKGWTLAPVRYLSQTPALAGLAGGYARRVGRQEDRVASDTAGSTPADNNITRSMMWCACWEMRCRLLKKWRVADVEKIIMRLRNTDNVDSVSLVNDIVSMLITCLHVNGPVRLIFFQRG